jgi:hypothetical protein
MKMNFANIKVDDVKKMTLHLSSGVANNWHNKQAITAILMWLELDSDIALDFNGNDGSRHFLSKQHIVEVVIDFEETTNE